MSQQVSDDWHGGAVTRRDDRNIKLFGLEITDTSLAGAASWIVQRAAHGIVTDVAFLNAHCVNVAYRSGEYRAAVAGMSRVFADGAGVRIAARVAGTDLLENVNGTDLFPVLCRDAARTGQGLYLLGARDGIAAAAAANMKAQIPDLVISGTHHGYISAADDEQRVIDEINASGASILLVALGVPHQEVWMARNRRRLKVPVVLGVGGLFDYYSGRIARAPLPLRKAGLEWAWRLALEPRRLANRYLVGNAVFLARLAWLRLMSPGDLAAGSAS
jgi:N-acetylglucosaminyldiphosphoundecaprenol N-acetyl-beta-D-mannosaminyltransferase